MVFVGEHPTKMDDLGVPYFRKRPNDQQLTYFFSDLWGFIVPVPWSRKKALRASLTFLCLSKTSNVVHDCVHDSVADYIITIIYYHACEHQ